jgi:hypothetical protein
LKVKKDSSLDLSETHAIAAAKEKEVKNFASALGIRAGKKSEYAVIYVGADQGFMFRPRGGSCFRP